MQSFVRKETQILSASKSISSEKLERSSDICTSCRIIWAGRAAREKINFGRDRDVITRAAEKHLRRGILGHARARFVISINRHLEIRREDCWQAAIICGAEIKKNEFRWLYSHTAAVLRRPKHISSDIIDFPARTTNYTSRQTSGKFKGWNTRGLRRGITENGTRTTGNAE